MSADAEKTSATGAGATSPFSCLTSVLVLVEKQKGDLLRQKNELNENEKLRRESGAELRSKVAYLDQLKASGESVSCALQTRKQESDVWKDEVLKWVDQRHTLLETLKDEVYQLTQQFKSAPDCYHLKHISEDIVNLNVEIQGASNIIQDQYCPEIAESEKLIQHEPVTILEIPGSAPTELTAKDLQIMILKLNEETQKSNSGIEKSKREIEELVRKEASI